MSLERITITQIGRYDKNKEGNVLTTKDGRPYQKLLLKSEEHGDNWISGFSGDWNKEWKVGDVVEAEIEHKGIYLNLKSPKSGFKRCNCENSIKLLDERVSKLESQISASQELPPDIEPEDVPF